MDIIEKSSHTREIRGRQREGGRRGEGQRLRYQGSHEFSPFPFALTKRQGFGVRKEFCPGELYALSKRRTGGLLSGRPIGDDTRLLLYISIFYIARALFFIMHDCKGNSQFIHVFCWIYYSRNDKAKSQKKNGLRK